MNVNSVNYMYEKTIFFAYVNDDEPKNYYKSHVKVII